MVMLDERSRALAYRLLARPDVMEELVVCAGDSARALNELRSAAALLFVFAISLEEALSATAPRVDSESVVSEEELCARWTVPPYAPAIVA